MLQSSRASSALWELVPSCAAHAPQTSTDTPSRLGRGCQAGCSFDCHLETLACSQPAQHRNSAPTTHAVNGASVCCICESPQPLASKRWLASLSSGGNPRPFDRACEQADAPRGQACGTCC